MAIVMNVCVEGVPAHSRLANSSILIINGNIEKHYFTQVEARVLVIHALV